MIGISGRLRSAIQGQTEHVQARQISYAKTENLTGWIPGRHDYPSIRRVLPDLADALLQLVHPLTRVVLACSRVPCTKVSPLESVDGSEIPFLTISQSDPVEVLSRPVPIPDVYVLVLQQLVVRSASYEPEELLEDAAHKHALGRQQRQGHVRQGEAHRRWSKQAQGASSSAIGLIFSHSQRTQARPDPRCRVN